MWAFVFAHIHPNMHNRCVCVRARVYTSEYASMQTDVCVCARVRACACVSVCERERERVCVCVYAKLNHGIAITKPLPYAYVCSTQPYNCMLIHSTSAHLPSRHRISYTRKLARPLLKPTH